jgi:GT2 family glycosyltransferase
MSPPKVSIIVLNWNGCDDTLECLESLRSLDYASYNVIVVDNGSQDGSVGAIARRFPEVEVIETGENLGYAGGNNVGIKHALNGDAEFILLLNNDTIVDPRFVSHLVSTALDHTDAAFFSPKIYFYSDPRKIWFAGGIWVEATARFVHTGYGLEDTNDQFNAVTDIDYACGCAVLGRTSAIRQIGLLDERFFLIYEDVDWCYRARAAGFRSIFVPQAVLWHKVSRSFGGSASPIISYFYTRNRLLWGKKHLSTTGFIALCGAMYSEIIPRFHFPQFAIDSKLGVSSAKKLYWASVQYLSETWKRFAALPKELATKRLRSCLYGVRDFALGRFGNPDANTLRRFK